MKKTLKNSDVIEAKEEDNGIGLWLNGQCVAYLDGWYIQEEEKIDHPMLMIHALYGVDSVRDVAQLAVYSGQSRCGRAADIEFGDADRTRPLKRSLGFAIYCSCKVKTPCSPILPS